MIGRIRVPIALLRVAILCVLYSQPKAKTGFSLFADEDEDDLFASLSKPATSAGNKVRNHLDNLNPVKGT